MNFAALILTHGRPDKVYTIDALRKGGYTGPVYLVIDDEDRAGAEYQSRYGEQVVVFDKVAVAAMFDGADQEDDRRTVVYARNASAQIAKQLGLTHYIQLDDDYTYFAHRLLMRDRLDYVYATNLDEVFRAFVEFLDTTGALTVAFAQGGDYIGGVEGGFLNRGLSRKAMNTFISRVDCPIGFVGRVNEDVNTYVVKGNRGELFFTFTRFAINQSNTQETAGGMTAIYAGGTYAKSFYPVMMAPSCVKISVIGMTGERIHHRVQWNHAVPKIISGKYRK